MGIRVTVECLSLRDDGKRYSLGEDAFDVGHDDLRMLYRGMRREYGHSIGKAYIDRPGEPAKHVGWVFQRREPFEDAWDRSRSGYSSYQENWYRRDKRGRVRGPGTYLRECWVTVDRPIRRGFRAPQRPLLGLGGTTPEHQFRGRVLLDQFDEIAERVRRSTTCLEKFRSAAHLQNVAGQAITHLREGGLYGRADDLAEAAFRQMNELVKVCGMRGRPRPQQRSLLGDPVSTARCVRHGLRRSLGLHNLTGQCERAAILTDVGLRRRGISSHVQTGTVAGRPHAWTVVNHQGTPHILDATVDQFHREAPPVVFGPYGTVSRRFGYRGARPFDYRPLWQRYRRRDGSRRMLKVIDEVTARCGG